MDTRTFARLLGIAFLLVGILGFIPIPGLNPPHGDDPDLTVEGPGHVMLLHLFHVNVLHNAVHLLFGVLGLVMSGTVSAARNYARIVAVSYLLLAVMGLIPAANLHNTFGLVPIHGHDVWLHALVGIVAAYFGFIRPAGSPTPA
jgi:hypothetical protein